MQSADHPTAQHRPELQELLRQVTDSGLAAGVQLRVRDERGEWVGSAGVRELGETAPPATDGHFRIGSTTKTFTATLVLQLVAEGTIGLDSPAAEHLPGYGLDPRITVRMLLQHTSGVFNFTGEYYDDGTFAEGVVPGLGGEWVAANQDRSHAPQDLARGAVAKPARLEPGTDWSYSNTNYVLARLLVEQVTGNPYPEELQRRILQPLGLSGTLAPEDNPEIPEPHAHGYYRYQDAEGWHTADTTHFNPSWISAAGDMISTTEDLQTFISALQSGKLLPDWLLTEMRTPNPKLGYGLGLFVEQTGCGGTVVHHNGNFWGWAALMISSLDGGTTVTASVTSGDAELDLLTMSQGFESWKSQLISAVFCP